jgi:hypothetical protein
MKNSHGKRKIHNSVALDFIDGGKFESWLLTKKGMGCAHAFCISEIRFD